MKKFIVIIFSLLLVISLGSCKKKNDNKEENKPEIKLEKESITLNVTGPSYIVKATVSDGKTHEFVLKAEKGNIVQIEGTKITGINAGETNISVSLKEDSSVSTTLKVKVRPEPVLEVGEEEVKLEVGDTYYLQSNVNYLDAYNTVVSVKTPDLIKLEGDNVIALKEGIGELTVTIEGFEHIVKTIKFNIEAKFVPVITVEQTNVTLNIGQMHNIIVNTNVEGNNPYTISCDNDNVIIENNVIKAVKEGVTTIIVQLNDYSASTIITLKINPDPTVILEEKEITLRLGKTYTVNPSSVNCATTPTYLLSVDNKALVDINGLTLQAKAVGETTVKVSIEGFEQSYATFKLTIIPNPVINVNSDKVTLELGSTYDIDFSVDYLESANVLFTTTTPDILEVTFNRVKALKEGKGYVNATILGYEEEVNLIIEFDVIPRFNPELELSLGYMIVDYNGQQSFEVTTNVPYLEGKVPYTITYDEEFIMVENTDHLMPNKYVVKALKEGTTEITVKLNEYNIVKIIEVHINPYPTLTLKETEIKLKLNNIYYIEPVVSNFNSLTEFEYEVSNQDIVEVDGFKIITKATGDATVTVKLKGYDDCKATIKVVVLGDPVIKLTENTVNLTIEDIYEIAYTVEYDDNYTVLISNLSPNMISLENNTVTALKDGSAVVELEIEGYPASKVQIVFNISPKAVDVNAPVISLEGVDQNITLNWGKTFDALNGIKAVDDIDGDITENIKVTNPVDSKTYGKYEVVYEVSDNAGNTVTLTRNIEVVWNYEVQFIGHMGCYYGAANSEEAFIYAASILKYQALECDVKQTKDGVFVMCHDDTFGGLTLASTNYEDLKDVEISSSRTAGYPSQYGEMPGDGKYKAKICTLERYLEICKQYNVKAVIELKSSNGITNSSQTRMPALMEVIKKCDMLNNVIFLGSSYNCLIWVKQNGYEYIPCQYLVGSLESETYFNRCVEYGLDISCNVTGDYTNSPEWIARYQDAGIKVSTYTFTQYVDYNVVQKWIDLGVDYVTCDWQRMDKLVLPDSSEVIKHTVKFYDHENNLLKETLVKDGRTAASPIAPEREGYKFIGWSDSIQNITSDLEVKAEYELVTYKITYDSNLYVLNKSTWASKNDFVNDFYNDLFEWIKANYSHLSTVSYANGAYTVKTNTTEYGSATFSSAKDIKDLGVYYFERTLATLIYKPISGTNSADYVPEVDNNYFLNTEPYRSKYIECNAYFLKALQTSYTNYSSTYQQASNNRVQIFFRFHQWCNDTSIAAFNNYPNKYAIKYLVGVEAIMPTDHISYTINDSFTLSSPTASINFLGWYLDHDCTGNPITEIKAGSTGDITLYAKWEAVEIPDVYSKVNYVLDGGINSSQNPATYLEGVSTILYPATKEGYIFKGWSKEEGSNSYITSISELTSGEITLYANYEYEVYSITYDLQNGEWGNKAEFTGNATTSITTTRKDDFWGGAYATDIYLDKVSSHPKATWSFRVGIAYSEVMGVYSVVSLGIAGKSFDDSKAEYVITISSSYNGYNGTSSFRNAVQVGQGVKITGDLDSGKATFEFYDPSNISGGTVENYVDTYTIASIPSILPTPKLEGKTFKGWALNQNSTEVFMALPENTKGNITLYAIYE